MFCIRKQERITDIQGRVWGAEKRARVERVVRRVLDRHVAGDSREGKGLTGQGLCFTLVLRCEWAPPLLHLH